MMEIFYFYFLWLKKHFSDIFSWKKFFKKKNMQVLTVQPRQDVY